MKEVFIFLVFALAAFPAKSQQDSIFSDPEIHPSFPGGYDSLNAFVSRNLKYPSCREDFEGRVYVHFTVNKDGSLSDIKVIKGLSVMCDKNALDLFQNMPHWIPGKVNGLAVPMRMIFPVRFTLGR